MLDVGMIINAQKVEHYEIAGYGSLVALAKQLGHDEAATVRPSRSRMQTEVFSSETSRAA